MLGENLPGRVQDDLAVLLLGPLALAGRFGCGRSLRRGNRFELFHGFLYPLSEESTDW
jgi:hypothetical protein